MTETDRRVLSSPRDHTQTQVDQAKYRVRDRAPALARDMAILHNYPLFAIHQRMIAAMGGPLGSEHDLNSWLPEQGGVSVPEGRSWNEEWNSQDDPAPWIVTPLVGEVRYGDPVNTGGVVDPERLREGVYEIYTPKPEGEGRMNRYVTVTSIDPQGRRVAVSERDTPQSLLTEFMDLAKHPEARDLPAPETPGIDRGAGMPPLDE
jgi:hypothetical protein